MPNPPPRWRTIRSEHRNLLDFQRNAISNAASSEQPVQAVPRRKWHTAAFYDTLSRPFRATRIG